MLACKCSMRAKFGMFVRTGLFAVLARRAHIASAMNSQYKVVLRTVGQSL